MTAKLITANHNHGNSLLISSQVERGKIEIVELSKPSRASRRKKKEEPVDFVLMRLILPLAIIL